MALAHPQRRQQHGLQVSVLETRRDRHGDARAVVMVMCAGQLIERTELPLLILPHRRYDIAEHVGWRHRKGLGFVADLDAQLADALGAAWLRMHETDPSQDGEVPARVSAGDLQRSALEQEAAGVPLIECLPFLGRDGYVRKGGSEIISAAPKGGKTELVTRVVMEWPRERVLWVTEESEAIWRARLAGLPLGAFDHVTLVHGLGLGREGILAVIQAGSETVVIFDTIRNLFGFEDERDNSEVVRALSPFLALCNQRQKTFIGVHHDRKGGGANGESVSGAFAFCGIVDVVLTITRDQHHPNRRVVRGLGRIFNPEDLVYERIADGSMVALGSPHDTTLPEVKARVLRVLNAQWAATKDVLTAVGEPHPSHELVRQALIELSLPAMDGDDIVLPEVERDPPISERTVKGKTVRWRRTP